MSTGAQQPKRVTSTRSINLSPEVPWTFLSNHSHVLLTLAEHPGLSLRQVALRVGITERSVQRIVTDLEEAGYLVRERIGRSNRYALRLRKKLRHPIEAHCDVSDLIRMVLGKSLLQPPTPR